MIRGETEARINLLDEYCNVEMTWTFRADSREEFIRNATKMYDWFVNDPIPGLPTIVFNPESETTEDPDN